MNRSKNITSLSITDKSFLRSDFGNSSFTEKTEVTANSSPEENNDSNIMNHNNEITRFDSKKIKIGKLLGKGAFCKVYEIKEINTKSRTIKNCYWYRSKIQSYENNINENIDGKYHRYALKMVRKSVHNNRNE